MKTTIGNYRCGKSIGQDILEKKIAARGLYEPLVLRINPSWYAGPFQRFTRRVLKYLL